MSVGDYDPSNKASTGLDIVSDKVDAESHNGPKEESLQRQLKNRHVAMIRYLPPFLLVACMGSLRPSFVSGFIKYWRYGGHPVTTR
jgi:hypothetical protein